MEKEPRETVNVAQTLAEVITSRDVADVLKDVVSRATTRIVNLDFKDARVISRSAAHELLSMKEDFIRNKWNKKEVTFINTNRDVENMLRLIAANRALPKTKKAELKIEKTDFKTLLKEVQI